MNRTHEYPHQTPTPTPKPDKAAEISRLIASVRSVDGHISERLALADSYESAVLQVESRETSREDRRRLRLVHAELNSLYRNRRRLLRALAATGHPKNRWTENRGVLIHLSAIENTGLEEYAVMALPRRSGPYILEGEPPEISRRRARYATRVNGAALQAFATLGVLLAIGLLANPLSEHPAVLLMAVLSTIIALTFFTEGPRYVLRHCGPNPPKPPFEHITPQTPQQPPRNLRPDLCREEPDTTKTLPQPATDSSTDPYQEAPAALVSAAPVLDPAVPDRVGVAQPQYFQQTLDLFAPQKGATVEDGAEPQGQNP